MSEARPEDPTKHTVQWCHGCGHLWSAHFDQGRWIGCDGDRPEGHACMADCLNRDRVGAAVDATPAEEDRLAEARPAPHVDVAEVLMAHTGFDGNKGRFCRCGEEFPYGSSGKSTEMHARHVADALTAASEPTHNAASAACLPRGGKATQTIAEVTCVTCLHELVSMAFRSRPFEEA